MGNILKKDMNKEEILQRFQEIWKKEGRLVAINGYVDKEGKNVVVYTFEYDDVREICWVKGQSEIPTLTTIYKGAQWFEEEIQEVMPVKFIGLNAGNRLFLPEEFKEGNGQILVLPLDELKKLKDK